MKFNLEKEDTLKIKGIAIILIILHNFYHNLRPFPSQNEFNFSIDKTLSLINIFKTDYFDIFRALFSFFGHYGVQLFIFLSAYGLTKKYLASNVPYRNIFLHSYFKIFFPFVFVLFLWIGYELSTSDKSLQTIIDNYGLAIMLKLLALNIPGYALSPVGPWWFYPMIVQFYLIFPILLRIQKKHGSFFLIIIAFVSIFLLMVFNKKILFFNVVGYLPELCLGILLATNRIFNTTKLFWMVVLTIFILGQFNYYFWFFGRSSFILIFLLIYQKLILKISNNWLIHIGKVALFAFLINGFLRDPFLSYVGDTKSSMHIIIVGLVYLLYILILSFLLNNIYVKLKKALT